MCAWRLHMLVGPATRLFARALVGRRLKFSLRMCAVLSVQLA